MKKVVLLGMVLVLCLAAVGIGYAHWTKTLYVDGVVTTGTFDAEMSVGTPSDNEVVKDVGIPSSDVVAQDRVLLVIENAYPSYEATFPVDVHCLGTVPLHINSICVEANDYLDVKLVDDLTGQAPVLPVQLHQCDEYWFDVVIHVLQNHPVTDELLPQDTQLDASIVIVADQFNHVP
jgi:hypothetical protein